MKQVNNTLYALNKDGSFQAWKVFTSGDTVIVEFGKLGGKKQQKETICKAKNVGRSNETTAEDQAWAEAVSKWEKQVRLGYRDNMDSLSAEEILSAMLAHDYLKRPNALILPCYVQPKLDGVRSLVLFKDGCPVFQSRGNKEYPVRGKLVEQVNRLAAITGFDQFDAELYIHGLSLQKIVSLAKKWRSHEDIEEEIDKDFRADVKRYDKAEAEGAKEWKDHDGEMRSITDYPERDTDRYGGYCSYDLELHIFDVPVNKDSPWFDVKGSGLDRLGDLTSVFNAVDEAGDFSHITVVMGKFCSTLEEVRLSVGEYMQFGFEGTMIRNFKGRYEFCQRSSDLLKWKIFFTAEAKVIDSVEDKNGEGVLLCEEKDGTKFSCKMKGTHAERKQSRMLKLVGVFITFSFQARTDAGVPQFPVGQYVRDCDPVTWEPRN